MKRLREYIQEAQDNHRALAHFNVANSDMVQAVFSAAQQVSEEVGEKIPLIIGVSEGERDAFGVTPFVDYIISLRNQHNYPLFTNADHTYSVERSCEAIDAGFDMVVYDGNKVSHEENVESTTKVVRYKNEINPECIVEAELGFIGSGSNMKDELPEGVSEKTMTKASEAKAFVSQTGIDALAPSVGNVHGMVKAGNPALNPQRVREVLEAAGVPLVLHGGSGSSDEDMASVINAGISVVHISTELRVAFRKGLEEGLSGNDILAPYKYTTLAKSYLQEVAADKIRRFWKG